MLEPRIIACKDRVRGINKNFSILLEWKLAISSALITGIFPWYQPLECRVLMVRGETFVRHGFVSWTIVVSYKRENFFNGVLETCRTTDDKPRVANPVQSFSFLSSRSRGWARKLHSLRVVIPFLLFSVCGVHGRRPPRLVTSQAARTPMLPSPLRTVGPQQVILYESNKDFVNLLQLAKISRHGRGYRTLL